MSSIPSKDLRRVRSSQSLHRQQQQEHNPYNDNGYPIQFSEEPYLVTNKFAVFTPTMESIERLYKSNNFHPQRHIQTPQQKQYRMSHDFHEDVRSQREGSEIERFANQIKQEQQQTLSPQNLKKIDNVYNEKSPNEYSGQKQTAPQLLHKLKSYKTNSTIGVLQGLPINKVDASQFNTLKTAEKANNYNTMTDSMKKTISYPDLPWVELDITKKYNDPFGQRNLIKTRGALRASGKETVEDMIVLSRSISQNLQTILKQQKDKNYLTENRLIPVPKIVYGPACNGHKQGKKFLIAENDAHQRETNVGYSRKANGTFYNH